MDGEYVAHVEQTGDTANGETQEQVFYPLNDHLGQPMMMLRADEKLSHEQYTDPYGKMYARYIDKSVGVDGVGPTGQNISLPGQYADDETGYHYNWNRYFDPSTANYLQSDLIGQQGGVNTFLYAGANPVMNVDPTGLLTKLNCEALKKLLAFDDVQSSPLGVIWSKQYNAFSFSDDMLGLNADFPSKGGNVDIDWMLRTALLGLGRVTAIYNYYGGKILWNSIQLQNPFKNITQEGNLNAPSALYYWFNSGEHLREIFQPWEKECKCVH